MILNYKHGAVIALVIANIIWGAAPPLFKWSLENIQPFTLAFLRFFIGALIILPFCYKQLQMKSKDFLLFFLMTFFGITVNIGFFFLSLQKTESINVPIIGSSAPLFIFLFSVLFLKETLNKKKFIGALIGFTGVLLIVLLPSLQKGFDGSITGNLFIIISVFASIIHLLLGKKLAGRYKPLPLIWWMFFIGSLTFVPFMWSEIGTHGFLTGLNIQGVTGIIYGAIGATAIANYLYFYAIKQLPASEVGLFIYLDPIIAIMIAIPLLGELPTPLYIAGAVLVFMGIFIAEGRLPYHPLHKLRK